MFSNNDIERDINDIEDFEDFEKYLGLDDSDIDDDGNIKELEF